MPGDRRFFLVSVSQADSQNMNYKLLFLRMDTFYEFLYFILVRLTISGQDKQTMYHVIMILVQIRDLLLVHLSHDHGGETSDVEDCSSHLKRLQRFPSVSWAASCDVS